MRRIPIRLKLIGALAVPTLTLLGVVYAKVSSTATEVSEVRHEAGLATALTGPQGVVTSIQDERNWTMIELIGMEGAIALNVTGYDDTRSATDQAVDAFVEEVDERGGRVAEEFQPAIEALDELDEMRQEIDEYDGPKDLENLDFGNELFSRYADVIDVFFDAGTQLAIDVNHSDLRAGAELVDVSSRQIEVIATIAQVTLVNVGGDDTRTLIEATALVQEFIRNADKIKRHDIGAYSELVTTGFPEDFTSDVVATIENGAENGAVDPNDMLEILDVDEENDYTRFVDEAADLLDSEAARVVSSAERTQRIYLALATIVVLLSIAASWLASRSITRPLRSLTNQATAMADKRLPETVSDILATKPGEDVALANVDPIEVDSRDETGDVAEALNTVQDAALGLAVEQTVLRRNIADSFLNLGRRNQNLLSRQLDFITELEQSETDPDVLADLFRLDHLATRMRRNAESLLVLADVETPRKWAAPVRITDIVRAALGEVEDYQRVELRGAEPVTILGTTAADLAHLLAELLENALAFSPPDRSVEIRGRRNPPGTRPDGLSLDAPSDDGADGAEVRQGGYTLVVVDAGIGMSPDELEQANRRLAGNESFTVAPSQYLGHYVAGKLAARHGIRIGLQSSVGHGITAVLHLPEELLASPYQERPAAASRIFPNPGDLSPAAQPQLPPSRQQPALSQLPTASQPAQPQLPPSPSPQPAWTALPSQPALQSRQPAQQPLPSRPPANPSPQQPARPAQPAPRAPQPTQSPWTDIVFNSEAHGSDEASPQTPWADLLFPPGLQDRDESRREPR